MEVVLPHSATTVGDRVRLIENCVRRLCGEKGLSDDQSAILWHMMTLAPQLLAAIDVRSGKTRPESTTVAGAHHIFIHSGRHSGKTTVLEVFLAAMIINVPGFSVGMIGSKRNNNQFVATVGRYVRSCTTLQHLQGETWLSVHHSEDQLAGAFLLDERGENRAGDVPLELQSPLLFCADDYEALEAYVWDGIVKPLILQNGPEFFIGINTPGGPGTSPLLKMKREIEASEDRSVHIVCALTTIIGG